MQQIIHTDLQKLETAIAEGLEFQGEYFLGIADNQIFPSRDLETAALYVIQGRKVKIAKQ